MPKVNSKVFLLPSSIKSMAAVHIKIHEDRKQYQMRISDCNNAIKLWGSTDNEEDLEQGVEKLKNLAMMASILQHELEQRLKKMKEK